MAKNTHFKRSRLSVCISLATVVAAAPHAAFGQDTTEEPLLKDSPPDRMEEIIVTGIRGSLGRAMDLKRDAQGIVDAISAEDIGKFPDTNLAESLQRITGVSIDRQDGEGSKITVRGLGPDFNLVTLNGRQMPAAGLEATGQSGTRSFDFANLASEGVQAVEVYKSSRASIPTGGLGATVNIVTPKPLSNPGQQGSLGLKFVNDESAADSSLTPEISGIYSNTFNEDKFGIAITGSYQNREGGARISQVGTGWRDFPGTVRQADWSSPLTGDWGGIPLDDGNQVNPPTDNDVYGTPQSISHQFAEFERTRINGQVTFQFAPTDDFEATLDYTYSKNEIEAAYNDIGAWFNFGGQATVFSDSGDGAAETPLVYSEDMTGGDLTMGAGEESRTFENDSIGINLKWQATERLSLELDYHSSTAEAGPEGEFGNSVGIAVSAYVRDRTTAVFSGDRPGFYLDILDGAGGNALRTEDLQVSGSYFRASEMKHDIDQLQLHGDFEFTDEVKVAFGVATTESDFYSGYSVNQRDSWGGLGAAGDLPEEFFSLEDIIGDFESSAGALSADDAAAVGQVDTEPFNQRFVYNFADVRDFAAANYDDGGGATVCADGSTYYCAAAPNIKSSIFEETDSAYIEFSWNTEIGTMPFDLNIGVRYESTKVSTPAQEQQYAPIVWASENELSMAPVGDPINVTDSGKYSQVLPSLDMALEVVDDVIVRASLSKSMARANWLDLRGGTVYNQLVRPTQGDASRGNPGLDPFLSTNKDLSVEWYFDDASYFAIGWFEKEVENFIGSRVVTENYDVAHPNFGPRADAARADGGCAINDTACIRQYIVDNFPDPNTAYFDGVNNVIVGIDGEDGPFPVQVTEVANSDDTLTYDGIEIAIQHAFDSGFGFQANYTMVDTDAEFDNLLIYEEGSTIRASQFAGIGASDTMNLVGFYETDNWQVRIAYNWRDSFLASTTTGTGNNPIYVDEYSQVDISASYDINDNFSVFFQGLNITEEYGRSYGRSENQVHGVFEGGARYNLGVRYSF